MTATRPPFAPLIGKFVRLDPMTEADLPQLHQAIGHPVVFSSGFGGGLANYCETEDSFREWAARYFRFGSGQPYAVRLQGGPHDGELVGSSTLAEFDPSREAVRLGWTAYDPRVWGTAVNAEVKLLLLERIFESGFGRVAMQTDSLNARSRASIAGIGATFEGIVRRDLRRADGTWRDTAAYSVLVEEWPQVRAGLETRLSRYDDRPVLYRTRLD